MFLLLSIFYFCQPVLTQNNPSNKQNISSTITTISSANTTATRSKFYTPTTSDFFNTTQNVSNITKTNPYSYISGMALYIHEDQHIPSISAQQQLVLFGENVDKAEKVWLHERVTCEEETLLMDIKQKNEGYVVIEIPKSAEDDEYKWPLYFICTQPPAPPFLHSSVFIVDEKLRTMLILYIFLYCGTLTLSALFTGLNLALMSLGIEQLELIRDYDEDVKAQRYAKNILPIREKGNFMMCTILLGNTMCNTVNAIVFDKLTAPIILGKYERIALITITPAIFITIFSEIVPQAICTKFALRIGSALRYVMIFFMLITCPVSWPLAKFLDFVIGKEVRTSLDQKMIEGVMREHKADREQLVEVVEKALNLQVRRAKDVMTPIDKVFMLSDSTVINKQLKVQLNLNRHTRIPVYKGKDKNCVVGVLNIKDLLLVDEDRNISVGIVIQLWFRSTLFRYVTSEMPVPQLMLELKRGFPLAIVVEYRESPRSSYEVIGIVTLEDNLEEVIGEIYDEKDKSRVATAGLQQESGSKPRKMRNGPPPPDVREKELVATVVAVEKEKMAKVPSIRKKKSDRSKLNKISKEQESTDGTFD